MIFSRRRGSKKRDDFIEARYPGENSNLADVEAEVISEEIDDHCGSGGGGPYDISQVSHISEQAIDLGALIISLVEDVEIRVQADDDGRISQVALISGDSGLQLAVFAAPRTESIWEEIRGGIRSQLRSDGFVSREVTGSYGQELCVKVRTPDGPRDLRFVGISGPRWLVRAVFQGPAALDPTNSPGLMTCLSKLVVNRGSEAMPAGEAVPLRLPREIVDKAQGHEPKAQGHDL